MSRVVRCFLGVIPLLFLCAPTASAQRAGDLRMLSLSHAPTEPLPAPSARIAVLTPADGLPMLPGHVGQERAGRRARYVLIGGIVGFVATALVARSMICPGTDCVDTGEAAFPIVGVMFWGLIGGGVGALVGATTDALLDSRERDARRPAGAH